MRILLAAKHPPAGDVAFGGVASWCKTIADQFSAVGHECVFWGPGRRPPDGFFDVGIISNIKATKRSLQWCDRIVNVCHGIVPEESPSDEYPVIYTSEELRDRFPVDGVVIRQPIDLHFWRAGNGRNAELVFYSYRSDDVLGLDVIARNLGLGFVHLRGVNAIEARERLQSASLVCASGRAALEAMACETPTVILDYRSYNGQPLCCPSIQSAMKTNYSGRGGVNPANIDLESLFRQTMAFQRPREHVCDHHDAQKIATEILALC